MSWVLNMPEYWIWQNSEYSRVLICELYTAFWICQNMSWESSEYILGLNMPGFWVTKGFKYAKKWLNRTWICLNMSEFTIMDRVLNMCYTIHSARLLYKLMSTYWEIGLFRDWSKIQDGVHWKSNYSFLTFLAKLSVSNL